MNARLPWRGMAAGLVLVAALASGCSTASTTSTPPAAPSASPAEEAPSISPTMAAIQKAIDATLVAYTGYRKALDEALRTGNAKSKALPRFAGDKALAEARANVLAMKRFGIVYTGEPVIEPQVVDEALDDARPTTGVLDCVDNSHWIPVYEATGESAAAPGQPRRVSVRAVVQYFDGAWRVMRIWTQRGITC